MAGKTGKAFERLVADIQRALHPNAVITPNDKLLDRHQQVQQSGKPKRRPRKRDVDVSVRITDGPLTLLVIVEVRDRGRPVGIGYIEEVNTKRAAVGADAAVIVSRHGFDETAITKAAFYGIRTFTYEEATAADWSGWLATREFSTIHRRYECEAFGIHAGQQAIELSEASRRDHAQDPNAAIFASADGQRFSVPQITQAVVQGCANLFFEGLEPNGRRVRRALKFNGTIRPELFVETVEGTKRVEAVSVIGEFWLEKHTVPLQLLRYRGTDAGSSAAEVAAADVEIGGTPCRVELIADRAGDVLPAGTRLSLRLSKLTDSH